MTMKIAAVTDDGKTISAHFGRALQYVVLTIEDGRITASELRDKANHRDFQQGGSNHDELIQISDAEDESEDEHEHGHGHGQGHGHGRHSAEKHRMMFENITDCQILLARGMGQGAYMGLEQSGIRPILTSIKTIDEAAQAVIDGSIEDHPERLH
ncbi:MAG: NifB/NifX family molybdenum-iron cluster-binding protein [Candidatus Promineifilaceae bacterium]|jgi:predicted Fe-Mo cluster-binding NifX family protein